MITTLITSDNDGDNDSKDDINYDNDDDEYIVK